MNGDGNSKLAFPHKVLVVTPYEENPKWRWVCGHLKDDPIEWSFRNLDLFGRKYPYWLPAAIRVAREARNYDLVISHQPYMTLYLSVAMRLMHVRRPHWSVSFNQGDRRIFSGIHLWIARRVLQDVDLLMTYSDSEREVYSRLYDIPLERFAFSHWTAEEPTIRRSDKTDVGVRGPYICCLGRNNRDFPTLLEAVKDLPVTLVLVCPQEALANHVLPDNVIVRSDLAMDECLAILADSLFSVVPIQEASTGAGHITMVAAMQLGKAQIVTDVPTVTDYFEDGVHGLSVQRGSVESMRSAIAKLMGSESLRKTMGENACAFASRWFAEPAAAATLRRLLMNWQAGVNRPTEPPGWVREPSHA